MSEILDEGLMTIDEAADFLAVSRMSVWRRMQTGELAYTHIGRSRRIPRTAVKALAAKSLKLSY
jgi:excisionase family DNA binding protein